MISIADHQLRVLVRKVLSGFSSKNKNLWGHSVEINLVDAFVDMARVMQRDGESANTKQLKVDIQVAELAIFCVAALAVALSQHDREKKLFPKDWLSKDGKPNPNYMLACFLVQLVNSSTAVIELIKKGLDTSARALARTVSDLSMQILVLTSFRDDFREYANAWDDEESNRMWFHLFARGQLHGKMEEIERRAGLSSDLVARFKSMRKHTSRFFSGAVHHSTLDAVLGAHNIKFKTGAMRLGLFGGESRATIATIEHLNFTLFYFVQIFFVIPYRFHEIKPTANDWWWVALALRDCSREAFVSLERQKNKSRERKRGRGKA